LKTETFCPQAQFLARILEKTSKAENFGEWGAKQTRQFQTLTHPEHLGRAFRVLIQSR
jgi:SAM-dependent MidA family methyltransferase